MTCSFSTIGYLLLGMQEAPTLTIPKILIWWSHLIVLRPRSTGQFVIEKLPLVMVRLSIKFLLNNFFLNFHSVDESVAFKKIWTVGLWVYLGIWDFNSRWFFLMKRKYILASLDEYWNLFLYLRLSSSWLIFVLYLVMSTALSVSK